MPYRVKGTTVQVKKAGKWVKRAKAKTKTAALRQVRLLNALKHGFKPKTKTKRKKRR
jgi:hypothetical protein